jgi:hypothetical protein
MRTRRDPETEEQRDERLAKHAQGRRDDMAAEDKAVDAMVKKSIELYGA